MLLYPDIFNMNSARQDIGVYYLKQVTAYTINTLK